MDALANIFGICYYERGDTTEGKFEWDDEKNRSNYKKHGIRFESAVLVFEDEQRIDLYDEAHSEYEERFITIGMVEDVLFVVYTERADRIRLISARIATEWERRLYYDR